MNAKKRFLFKWTNLLFAVLIALGGIFFRSIPWSRLGTKFEHELH